MLSPDQDAESAATGGRPDRLPVAAMGATFALIAAASFLPGKRLWGINHLAFYPLYIRLAALALLCAALTPPVSRGVYGALSRAADRLPPQGRLRNVAALAAAAASVAVFWLLRSSTLLLGDARLVASNFEHAFHPDYALIVSSPRIILLHESIARGTALLYHYAARISLEAFGAPAVDGIRFLNCLLGGVLVYVMLRAVMAKPRPGAMAVWTVTLIMTSGAMELFFGYVENYTPLLFFGALYVLSGLVYMESGKGRFIPAVFACLILAVFMHIQGLLLLPSFVLLLIRHSRARERVGPAYLTAALLAVTAAGTYLFAVLTRYGRHFLPVFASEEVFGALSPSHLADIANELVLVLPAVLVAAALARTRPRNPDARLHFLLLVLLPCLIFLFVFKPDLGMARDWDLFSITALGLVPLALVIVGSALRAGGRRLSERLTAPAAVMSAVLALAWVGVNADPGRSARRFEAMLEYDLTRAPYAYEVLAQHYRNRGDLDEAVAIIEKGTSLSYNPRLMSLAADLYDERGDTEHAIRLYREVLERQPEIEGARRNLVLLLHRLGRYGDLYQVSRDGTRYHPEKPVYHYFYGLALIDAGEVQRGIDELLTCRRLGPGDDVIANIDRALDRLEAMGHDVGARDSATRFSRPRPGR